MSMRKCLRVLEECSRRFLKSKGSNEEVSPREDRFPQTLVGKVGKVGSQRISGPPPLLSLEDLTSLINLSGMNS